MKLLCAEDRTAIENKYHRTDEPFDAFNRMQYHGWECAESEGFSDAEMDAGLAAYSKTLLQLSHPEQKARMVEYVLRNTRIDVNEHDWFFCMYTWNRPLSKYTVNPWHVQLLEERHMDAIEVLKTAADAGMCYGGGATAGYSPLDFEHTIPDWDSLMALGFRGILERARRSAAALREKGEMTEKKEAFFRGIEIEYEAVLAFIGRLVAMAESRTHAKAAAAAQSLRHLYEGAPRDTMDALQLMYLYFMISESVDHYQVRSLGFGLDATLLPFYRADLAAGRITEDGFTELLSYFLLQFSAIGNYWGQPFYLGGTNADGSTKVNELSYLILKTYRAMGIYNPKIQLKASERTPKDFLLLALDMIRTGSSSIVFLGEDHMIRSIMNRGGTYEEGCEAVISGCYEYNKKNKSLDVSSTYPNIVKPVLLAMENGFDRVSGKQIGPKTGRFEDFSSFGQFYDAYVIQLKHQLTVMMDAIKETEASSGEVNPSLLFSAANPYCCATMTDALDSGIENDCGVILGGLGTAVDAVMAVYELIYEKKVTTPGELHKALLANWQGYDRLRAQALGCVHKYGNGDRLADSYAAAILHAIGVETYGSRRTAHGGRILIDGHSARAYIILGAKTPATPDGRRDGDEISKNVSPTPGMDRKGVTALIRSATAPDTELYTHGGCLDVMLHPSAVQGEEGLQAFYAILVSYFRLGGLGIHFNVFDADQLRDAQVHPEKYRNLQIRVCGWNVLWNDMPKSEQDVFILRAENIR